MINEVTVRACARAQTHTQFVVCVHYKLCVCSEHMSSPPTAGGAGSNKTHTRALAFAPRSTQPFRKPLTIIGINRFSF